MLSDDPTSRVQPLAEALKGRQFKLQPRYTTVIHQVRKRMALSMPAYCVIDSIAKLSNKPDHQWCTRSKDEIAEFLILHVDRDGRAVPAGRGRSMIRTVQFLHSQCSHLRPGCKTFQTVCKTCTK
jgi:hypothetical protein